MAQHLTKKQVIEFKGAFKLFDRDNSGSISAQELGDVLRSLGQKPTAEELHEMIAELDGDKSGLVDLQEFLDLMGRKESELKEVRAAFSKFDRRGDGYITLEDLRKTMKELGEAASEAELAEMMAEADPSGSGNVSFDGFVRMMGAY